MTTPSQSGAKVFLVAASSLLIFLLAIAQALGLLPQAEQLLIIQLPKRLHPPSPQVVLISLEKNSSGEFQPLDVAMALRGLGKFHPHCIAINGLMAKESGDVPLLPGILADIRAKGGIQVILARPPSPTSTFRSVPLVRYALQEGSPHWPLLDGEALPANGDAFALESLIKNGSLPLLALARHGVPIGSIWWWMLPGASTPSPSLLLFEHFLFLGDRIPLALNSDGSATPAIPRECVEMPLDDFLFQMEQREQGTLSPTFDAFWEKSIVLLGSTADRAAASGLASLSDAISWKHPSPAVQGLFAAGWIVLFLSFRKIRLSRWISSLFILLVASVATGLFLPAGVLFPFLPALLTATLLLIF